MQHLRVLHSDESLIVFEKPSGLSVHPSERAIRLNQERTETDVLRILRNQTGRLVFPVHRLDRATQGVMVMAFDGKTAGRLQEQFRVGEVQKKYLLLCRGWLQDSGSIELPLESDSEILQEARTDFMTLARFELPVSCGRYPSSRFSMVQAMPATGRYHQIRRHFKKFAHPLIGDSMHGDGRQNRIWRNILGDSRLCLMAWSLQFRHPHTHLRIRFRARFPKFWHRIFECAEVCPIEVEGQETKLPAEGVAFASATSSF